MAADMADDRPRAAMIAAPRFCTVSMNGPRSQSWSVMTVMAGWPLTRAFSKSGYCVALWLPQMATLVTEVTGTPAFWASWAAARFWSRRVRALKRSRGTSPALFMAMRALVLAGLPTTSTRTSLAATSLIACPWPTKMGPLTLIRSPRSMPFDRGREPMSSAQLTPSKATRGSSLMTTLSSRGKAQSSSSMTTPSSAPNAWGISSRCRDTRVSGPNTSPLARRGRME